MKRYFYLDNIKVVLTFLVIFQHAGLAYFQWAAWPVKASNPADMIPWMERFLTVNAAFMMGLFFFISGYFIPGSYDRQGFFRFLWKKVQRLIIPLVFMGTVLSFWEGHFTVEHLWFLEVLFFFSFVYALWRLGKDALLKKIRSRIVESSDLHQKESPQKPFGAVPSILVLALVSIAISVLAYYTRKTFPVGTWRNLFGFIAIEPAHFPQYAIMFILGLFAARGKYLDRMNNGAGVIALAAGLIMALFVYLAPKESSCYAFMESHIAAYESFLAVFLIAGLIWLFCRFFNETTSFLKWCSANAFGVYVVHWPIVVLFQKWLDPILLPGDGTLKFLMVGIISAVISFLITWGLRAIPGVKKVL